MTERDPLDLLRKSVANLLDESLRSYRRRNFALSTHLAILASEECAKYLLLYCKRHLPPDAYRKRFQHAHKYRVSGAHHWMAGKFSVIYVLHRLGEGGHLGDRSDALAKLVRPLAEESGWGSPLNVAEAISWAYQVQKDPQLEDIIRAGTARTENDRLRSVYVDISEDGEVISSPSDITRDAAKYYLEGVLTSRAMIDFLISEPFDIEALVQKFPRRLREETIKRADDLIVTLSAVTKHS